MKDLSTSPIVIQSDRQEVFPSVLNDDFGRFMRKLRISLIDACNMRCLYCMPEHTSFANLSDTLPPERLKKIVKTLVGLGVTEVRLTGGEPLLYPQFAQIVSKLAELNINQLGLTTNGSKLEHYLSHLYDCGCRNLNISLDSLKPETFDTIVRRTINHRQILDNIQQAVAMGFKVKVNVVLMKEINTGEINNFVAWAQQQRVELRFLELMKVGPGAALFSRHFMPAKEALSIVKQHWDIQPLTVPFDATSRDYRVVSKHDPNKSGKIGFIASESMPFCTGCSRLRLNARGFLRACLFSEQEVDLSTLTANEMPAAIKRVISLKPINRINKIDQNMNYIGG